MPDPNEHKDRDTIIIKPMAFTGTILMSAGAGLAAGLLICWLFCSVHSDEDPRAVSSTNTLHHTLSASQGAPLRS